MMSIYLPRKKIDFKIRANSQTNYIRKRTKLKGKCVKMCNLLNECQYTN